MSYAGTLVLILLGTLTDLAYRPLWPWGVPPDPTLVILIWLAPQDRRRIVHGAVLAVVALRCTVGLDSFLVAWLPLAAAVEGIRLGRAILNPRNPVLRISLCGLACAAAFAVDRLLHGAPELALQMRTLGLHACGGWLWAILLFPILDCARPSLKAR